MTCLRLSVEPKRSCDFGPHTMKPTTNKIYVIFSFRTRKLVSRHTTPVLIYRLFKYLVYLRKRRDCFV